MSLPWSSVHSQGSRQGVHPFCGQCTDETVPWPAPDTETVFGVGTLFHGAADPCSRCGSVVKRMYFRRILLSVHVSPGLRSDAACPPERLLRHVHGRSRAAAQIIRAGRTRTSLH